MRTFDANLVESIVNYPACLSGQYRMPNKPLVYNAMQHMADHSNHFCFFAGGGWAFLLDEPTVYRCHFAYLPFARGQQALNHSRACFDYIHGQGARMITGWIATNNERACRFVEALGCEKHSERAGDYTLNGKQTTLSGYKYEFRR